METDLSLIEISGEDDSLLSLQQSPTVSYDSPYFSCSPLLHFPRSTPSFNPPPPPTAYSTDISKDEKDKSKPISSSSEDINKENLSANKPEAPKLNVEPQQMKRKKKGGGFNLRKSLAWNRAFFTEEGVLDPLELSMLSGNTMSVIHEGRESLSSELDGPCVSPGLKALEHKLFKELPSSARNQGSKVAGKTSAKLIQSVKAKMHPASPQNMKGMKFSTMSKKSPRAKRKVLSAQDINRSASKRNGCPRPGASSSLKRTSNTNVTTKEPRGSTQLATKSEPLAVSIISRSSVTSSSHTKSDFTSQPATGLKNTGIKGISSNARSSQNDAKSGPGAKQIKKSTAQPGRSLEILEFTGRVATELGMHSSSDLQLPLVSLANNSLQGLMDAVVPEAAHPLDGHNSKSRKSAVSLSQSTCHYGGNMQHAQIQIAKPSGLRMPSPSLGFFGQSKPSNSQSELQRGPHPCNPAQDSISNISKAGVSYVQKRPPRPSRMIPTSTAMVQSVTSAVTNASSCGTVKSESELSDSQKVAVLLQVNSKSTDKAKSEQQLRDAGLKPPDDGAPFEKVEKLSCIGNIGLQINDLKLSQQSGPCELEKDGGKSAVDVCPRSGDLTTSGSDLLRCVSPLRLLVEVEGPSETSNALAMQQVEDRKYEPSIESHSVSPESHTASVNNSFNKNGLELHEEKLSGLYASELSPQQAELKKHGTCRVDPITEMQSQRLIETLAEDCSSSKKGDQDCISNAADNVLEVKDCGAVCCSPAHSTDMEPTGVETVGIDCFNGGLQVAEVQMLSVESTLLVASCKRLTDSSAADSDWMISDSSSAKSAEHTETLNSCVITEQVPLNNCKQPSKGGLENEKYSEACPKTNDTFTEQLGEDKECKPSMNSFIVNPESDKENLNNNLYETVSEVHEKQLSGLYELKLSPQQERLKKYHTERLNCTLVADCRCPNRGDEDYITKSADYILEVLDHSADSDCPTHSVEAEPPIDETSETDCLNGGFHAEEVQKLSVEASLLVGASKSITKTPPKDSNWMSFDSPSAKSADKTEILDPCCLTEQISQNNYIPPSEVHLQNGNFSEECQEKSILQSFNCVASGASDVSCSHPSVNEGCDSAENGKVEGPHRNNAFTASVHNETVVRNFRHNVEDNAFALDTVCKSDIIGEITTNNTTEENYYQCKLENSNVVSQISPSQVDVASGINNMSLHGVISRQSDLSGKTFFSDMRPEASYSPEKEAIVLYSDCSTEIYDLKEHVAQEKLIPCSNETDCLNGGFHAEEVQMLSIEASLLVGGCTSLTKTPPKDSNWMVLESPSAKSAEQTEILDSCLTEQISQNNYIPPSEVHLQNGNFSEECQEKSILQSLNCAASGASDVLCSHPSINQGCNSAENGKVEGLHGKNSFTSSVHNEMAVRNFRHNVEDNASALETVCKSDIIDEIITNNTTEENYCQSKFENSNVVSQISPSQVDVPSGINNMSLHGVINKQSDPSEKIFFFSDIQPEASYSPEKGTVVLCTDFSTEIYDLKEHVAQEKLIPCSDEIEQVNQNCEVHDDILGQENGSFKDVNRNEGYGLGISRIPRKMDEVAGTVNTTKETINEDALVHFISESILADSNTFNFDYSIENKSFLSVHGDKSRRLEQDCELQNLDLVIEQARLENLGLSLGDNLPFICNTVDSQGKGTIGNVPLESESFAADLAVERNVEYQQSLKPSSDNVEYCTDCVDSSYDELDNQSCPLNLDSPSSSECYQISSVADKESKCPLYEKTNGTSNGIIQQIVPQPCNTIFPLEGEINIHQSNDSFESQLQDGLHSDVYPEEEVKDGKLSPKKSAEDKKQGVPTIELPPNAAPFSDEWLAALEAAGEEILARKGGAVQNSPPDKSSPEPSPWSPVKRKNSQGLGPFDCTKFTNPTDPSSTSN